MYVCMYVCTHVCMYVCVHACMYACTYAHTDITRALPLGCGDGTCLLVFAPDSDRLKLCFLGVHVFCLCLVDFGVSTKIPKASKLGDAQKVHRSWCELWSKLLICSLVALS